MVAVAELVDVDPAVVARLRGKLSAPGTDITEKYRILWGLRSAKGPEATDALVQGAPPWPPHDAGGPGRDAQRRAPWP